MNVSSSVEWVANSVDPDQTVCPNTMGKYGSLIKSNPLRAFEHPIIDYCNATDRKYWET